MISRSPHSHSLPVPPLHGFDTSTTSAPDDAGANHDQSAWSKISDDTGAATAEYAIVIMAAVSFAGLLVTIMRSGEVRSILTNLVQQALSVG